MKSRNLLLIVALAALTTAIACSKKSNRSIAVESKSAVHATVRPAALVTVAPAAAEAAASAPAASKTVVKPPASKLLTFTSRDYGVSFTYPWQYRFVSAKAMAGDDSLRPSDDGSDGQFTLARIEVPRGFYPDTDFESAYLALSLNQDLDEQGCNAALGNDKLSTETINGVDFRWKEADSGGRGSALRQRNYVSFVNGTCYEIEMAVKTSNPDGLARELDPEQVMRRLNGVLHSVSIMPAMKDVAAAQSPAAAPQQ